jgi:quercetin dioxygenase-like cupin family protein
MSAPYIQLDLAREIDRLFLDGPWGQGRSAKTLAKYDDLRLVLTAVKAGTRIPTHDTDGRIAIQCVRGRLQVHAEGRVLPMAPGTILTLDRGVPHDVEALEDSAFLLTITWSRG